MGAASASSRPPNLLQNSDFGQWDGKRLIQWQIEVPPGVAYARGETSADMPFKCAGIVLSSKKAKAGRCSQLGQGIAPLKPKQLLDVVVVARAESRTEIEIAASQGAEDAATSQTKTRMTLWPSWQWRTARIETTASSKGNGAYISLIIPNDQ